MLRFSRPGTSNITSLVFTPKRTFLTWKVDSPHASCFVAADTVDLDSTPVNYFYGGTRMVPWDSSDNDVHKIASNLARSESALKNVLINKAVTRGALKPLEHNLPQKFLDYRVHGARCIIRPASQKAAEVLSDCNHTEFSTVASGVFSSIGSFLNSKQGRIKLTPDFGRYAGLADILHEYTPHVLGISRDKGGCGGKSTYSSTGILAAMNMLTKGEKKITLIGSDGAMGSTVTSTVLNEGKYPDVVICDLKYQETSSDENAVPKKVKAEKGRFTDECLSRGGMIVATTVGDELVNSNWKSIPSETVLLLAHNSCLPSGPEAHKITSELQSRGILAIPGQILTLGGALTSRLEWVSRQQQPAILFNKPFAHEVVSTIVTFLLRDILALAQKKGITPYAAMLQYAEEQA